MGTLNKLGQLFSQKVVRSLSAGVAAGTVMCAVGAVAQPANAALIGGINVEQFASSVDLDGWFEGTNGDVYLGLTDEFVETYGYSVNGTGTATFTFSNPILNLDGFKEIALFDLGAFLGEYKVIINNEVRNYTSKFTGFKTNDAEEFNINVAQIDLSDFGINPGQSITSFIIDFETNSPPTIGLVGAIKRSAPEPSAMFGLLATVGFLASQRRLKFARKAQ